MIALFGLTRKIERSLNELKGVAERVRKRAPDLAEDVRLVMRHPRVLASWIEDRSPWLSRRLMGAASNLAEPFTIGMGLKVDKLGEDFIEVVMPGNWRNQGEGGLIHTAALTALGESAARMFWEHHLDLRDAQVESKRVEVRILVRPEGEMRAVFRLQEADREAILHQLRSKELISVDTQTLIYDKNGRLIAEVDVEWQLRRQLALGPSQGS